MTDARLTRPSWRGRTNVDALTIAALARAEKIGGHEFVVTQGSYQSGGGDVNSAGTHDRGGVVDLRWCGHRDCILALRRAGFAAWHRTPKQGPWPDHIHAVVIDHPRLAASAARQVASYRAGRNGLASNGPDDGPRPAELDGPTFPYPPKPKADPNQKSRRRLLQLEKQERAAKRPRLADHLKRLRISLRPKKK